MSRPSSPVRWRLSPSTATVEHELVVPTVGWLPKPRLKAQPCLGPDPECISPQLHLPRPLISGPVAWWIWFQLRSSLERSSGTSTSAIPLNSDLHSPSTSMFPRNCISRSKSSFRIPQWNAIRHRILNCLISSRVFHPPLFVSSHIPNQQHSQPFRLLEVAFFQAAWSLLPANGATEIPHPASPWSGMMLVCSFNVNSHPIPSTQISVALPGLPCRHSHSHTHTHNPRESSRNLAPPLSTVTSQKRLGYSPDSPLTNSYTP